MSSSDRGKVDELSAKLARVKQQFDRGLAVQAGAIAVESDEKLKQILSEIRELTCFLLITDLITFSPGSTQDDYLNPDSVVPFFQEVVIRMLLTHSCLPMDIPPG